MKRSRAEEIFFEDLRIRQNAIDEGRGLTARERKHLQGLAVEAEGLKPPTPEGPPPPARLAERDPSTLPASMRPGVRGNE